MNIENFHSMRAYPRMVNKPPSSYCIGATLGGKNTTVDSLRLRQPGRGKNTTGWLSFGAKTEVKI